MEINLKRAFSLVLAMSKNKGIGYEGKLPWEIPHDLKHFKNITSNVITEKDDFEFMKNNLLHTCLEHIKSQEVTNLKKNMSI